ncbi:hypothetical protein PVAP13_2NG193000 [Panicum virgatum]|uniref:Uncharacterized protein n=1 Tax=Panicum virgatum TaxID=38727 RepID=A0A8T0VL58_PANVG|nr:hypothetical protein PVAP13_2NG193000 [Panicum virgatum]
MSTALLLLHGSELPTSSAANRSLLLHPWQRGARGYRFRFSISRFGFRVKYSGFLHLDPFFLLCCT